MKKIYVAALGCITLLGAASCSNGDKSASDKTYTEEQRLFGDSIATALGNIAGANENSNLARMWDNLSEEQRSQFSKEKFLKGLELVLTTDTADLSYLNGIYTGLNLYNPMIGSADQTGCPVDPAKVIAAFKETYLADSMPSSKLQTYSAAYQQINLRIREKADEKRRAEQADVIKANGEEGKAYADKMLAEGYQKSESGLVYKIENPGKGKVTPDDNISIRYVGKHVNGEVFDQSGDQAYQAKPTNFIPGFAEGLTLVGEGGTITMVIPGNLAYGDNGMAPKIAPNETLVFEVTVESVNK